MKRYRIFTILFVFIFTVFFGCTKKQVVKNDPLLIKDAPQEVIVGELGLDEPSIRGKNFEENKEFKIIYFEFDSIILNSEAKKNLKEIAQWLETEDYELLVEGHCDQAGSTEYNLGLGQRRARVVRKYLTFLGIHGRRIATISYGEEKPLVFESDEAFLSKNRRAEIKINYEKNSGTIDESL